MKSIYIAIIKATAEKKKMKKKFILSLTEDTLQKNPRHKRIFASFVF